MNDTIRIVVIGNYSSGKTSFLRTLMRNLSFGKVGFLPSTNSKNEISDSNVTFVDTPGFQCAEMVREWADEAFKKLERPSPEKVIDLILKHQDRTNRQLQEGVIKHDLIAWQALKDADVILFLVDIRQNPNLDGNLESSCLLLPDDPGTLFIFNFLPIGKSECEKRRKPWDVLKKDWGIRGTFLDYDAFHRDYKDEENILQLIKTKLSDSSKIALMERYIQKRIGEEYKRLQDSFEMVFSLIKHLSEISCYIESVPKQSTDEENKTILYEKIKTDLQEKLEKLLFAFCNSILSIWGFQTHENSGNSELLLELPKSKPDQYPMSELVQLNTSRISRILSNYNVENSVRWHSHLSNLLPLPIYKLLAQLRGFRFLPYKKICGKISLKSHTELINSFIPCALDFIKKVRERGFATPSSRYHLTQDDQCKKEIKITFIMPTEPGVVNIDAAFKDFKWKSQKTAQEWIPELLKAFGMKQES